MDGFFNLEEIEITQPTIATRVKSQAKEIIYNCEQCGLYKNSQKPLGHQGTGNKNILVVLGTVTRKADRLGKVMVGETRRLIQDMCKTTNMTLDDIYVVNAIRCPNKRMNKATIPSCRILLYETIKELAPSAIIAMGSLALNVLVGDKVQTGNIHRFDGYAIPFHGFNTIIYPTYGVRDLIIDKYNPIMLKKIQKQFLQAQYPKEYINYEELVDPAVELLHKDSDINEMLHTMANEEIVAFDYETTGIQPYRTGHKIICMSISNGKKSYCFMVHKRNIPAIRVFLQSDVPKIAHNAKYEMIWSKVLLNTEVNNIVADTMLIAHSLNNNKNLVSLKFQGFVNFGIAQYEEDIQPLFKSNEDKGVHSFNKLYTMDVTGEIAIVADKLMYYCAMDSLLTSWLYTQQKEQIAYVPHIQKGIDLFLEATKAFVDIEYAGMFINTDKIEQNLQSIQQEMKKLYTQIYETTEVKQWDSNIPFNFSSNKDLAHLLYTILQYSIYKTTETGQPSTDKETLEKIREQENSEFLSLLAKYKKLDKIQNTYLNNIKKGAYNNVIHPSFNLHTVITFRSCVAKGTKILVCKDFEEHPEGINIEDVKKGDLVYCYDDNLHPVLREVLWSGKTGHREVVRVHYISKGAHKCKGYIDVTPEHKIRTINGDYVEAQYIETKQKVLAGFRNKNNTAEFDQLEAALETYGNKLPVI